jgi:hypothetical protein
MRSVGPTDWSHRTTRKDSAGQKRGPNEYCDRPAERTFASSRNVACSLRRLARLKYSIDVVDGRSPMRRLLTLAALVFAFWAIDSYAFDGRYWSAAGGEVNYCVKILNNTVQSLMNPLRR